MNNEVSYVDYNAYIHAVLEGTGEAWDWLCGAGLIIGGVDFSGSFLYVHQFSR
jgi:hypothetical protein